MRYTGTMFFFLQYLMDNQNTHIVLLNSESQRKYPGGGLIPQVKSKLIYAITRFVSLTTKDQSVFSRRILHRLWKSGDLYHFNKKDPSYVTYCLACWCKEKGWIIVNLGNLIYRNRKNVPVIKRDSLEARYETNPPMSSGVPLLPSRAVGPG